MLIESHNRGQKSLRHMSCNELSVLQLKFEKSTSVLLKTGCYCPLPTRHNVETPENSQAGEVVFASGVWKSTKSAILSTIVGASQVVWTGYTYNISRLVPEARHSLHDTIKRQSCGD